MKSGKKYGCRMMSLLGMFIVMMTILPVKAAEGELSMNEAVVGTLQRTIEEAEIKKDPDNDSDTLASLSAGTAVIVYGESDSWSEVEYRGIEGYIKSAVLEMYGAAYSEDLEQEFRAVEDETLRKVDEYELMQKEKRASTIWGTVIAVLIIAIFAVGIVSALKQSKEGELKQNKEGEK